MSEFDKVVGYQEIKEELMQICDMARNPQVYKNLGAKLPKGILLAGDPGLGKTLMAECFIKECRLKAFTLRRDSSSSNFLHRIKETFENAKESNAPSIVFLDDMDKFANEDYSRSDAEEYVAVQAGIDSAKGCEVLVIATVNDSGKLPPSLIRSGRFDRIINVDVPDETDAEKIIIYYLRDKKLSKNIMLEDISKMMSYNSCAELETILNEAAIRAGYARHDSIEIDDLVESVLRTQYDSTKNTYEMSDEDKTRYALHEAGHLVVSEILCPGSIGFASIKHSTGNKKGGFVHQCRNYQNLECRILVSLAGKAAVEMYYPERCTEGCSGDIEKASRIIRNKITSEGMLGFGMFNVSAGRLTEPSESLQARLEAVTQAELERYMARTRDILIHNRVFLEKTAAELAQKNSLLYSDIRRIREIVPAISCSF